MMIIIMNDKKKKELIQHCQQLIIHIFIVGFALLSCHLKKVNTVTLDRIVTRNNHTGDDAEICEKKNQIALFCFLLDHMAAAQMNMLLSVLFGFMFIYLTSL